MYLSKPHFFIRLIGLGNVLDGVVVTILKEKINSLIIIPTAQFCEFYTCDLNGPCLKITRMNIFTPPFPFMLSLICLNFILIFKRFVH